MEKGRKVDRWYRDIAVSVGRVNGVMTVDDRARRQRRRRQTDSGCNSARDACLGRGCGCGNGPPFATAGYYRQKKWIFTWNGVFRWILSGCILSMPSPEKCWIVRVEWRFGVAYFEDSSRVLSILAEIAITASSGDTFTTLQCNQSGASNFETWQIWGEQVALGAPSLQILYSCPPPVLRCLSQWSSRCRWHDC